MAFKGQSYPFSYRDIYLLLHGPKLSVLPWPERKSRRGRPKTIETSGHACLNPLCDYFAIAAPAIDALVSNGCRGKQRIRYFKCQACGGCRTSRFGTPLYWLKTPLARITMVMTAMSEGVDISAAGRIFDHHHTTITRWIERCGDHSERLHQRLFHRALSIGHLQLDELVTKVKQDAERIWVWTAVAAQSKLIRSDLKVLFLTGIVQTAFVERANLTLRELIAPLSRRTWSIAYDRQHLQLQIQWGLAYYYHFCHPHQSLTKPIRGPSKRRYRTLVMAANLVRKRWSVQDLLQLSVPEGIWLDPFPATQGCR